METTALRINNPVLLSRRPRRDSISQFDLSVYDLNKETDRRKTFVDNCWDNRNVQSAELALLGFYFIKKPDYVRCKFCNVVLSDFTPNDDTLKEHLTFSPNCPLLRRRETDNKPIDCEQLNEILPPASYDECGARRRKKSKVEEDVEHPEFRLFSSRLNSFETWPVGIKQKPKELAEAGFFYNGQSDYTTCFSCGTTAGKWETDDNPWVEHKKLANGKLCNYLKMNQEKVKTNEKRYEDLMKLILPLEENAKAEDSEKEVDYENACKICLAKKSSIAFLPCKHVAVCGECVFGLDDKCPICRSEIKEKVPLYFA